MTPKLKKKWIAALRSGVYTQGRGVLANKVTDDKTGEPTGEIAYCCLGVLHKVAKKGSQKNLLKKYLPFGELKHTLDEDVLEELVDRNDGRRWSFKKIAAWIDKKSVKYLTTGAN